jgi:hypothetical protein
MAFRNVGLSLRNYTTAQIAALVARFGPTGTQEVGAIKPGTLVFNTTTTKVMMYTGTDFANVDTIA